LEGYRLVGYDAVVLGDHEWSALAGPLATILRATPLKYLSTSAAADSADLPVVDELVYQTPAGPLAVLSYLGPDTMLFAPAEAIDGVALEGMEEIGRRAIRLKARGCAVILVTHVTEVELDDLVLPVGVDLVIQADVTSSDERPGEHTDVPLVKVGGGGCVAAIALDLAEGRIAAMNYRLEIVTDDWPVDPRLLKLFQAYVAEMASATN